MKVYRVYGSAGEWEDHVTWTADCFFTQKSAEDYVSLCMSIVKKIEERAEKSKNTYLFRAKALYKFLTPIDPQYSQGTYLCYDIEELEVGE